MSSKQTVIVTGASQGIGAGVVEAFLERGYNVVANSRNITNSSRFRASDKLALVSGNIGEIAVAAKVVETAITTFGSIDALVKQRRHILRQALHGVHGGRLRGAFDGEY